MRNETMHKKRSAAKKGDVSGRGMNGLLAIALLLLFLVCIGGGGLIAMRLYMPSFKVDPYYKRVQRGNPDEYAIVFGNEAVSEKYYALSFEDDVLVDMDFISDYGIDPYLFWDGEEQTLTVSTPLKIIRMNPDETYYLENGEKKAFTVANTALFVRNGENGENGKVFIPVSFAVEFYQIDCDISREMKTLIVDNRLVPAKKAVAKRSASVRYKPDIKSDIAEKVKKGSEIRIYGGERDGFYSIRTSNGALGYMKTSDITGITSVQAEEAAEDVAPLPKSYAGRSLMLVWDQISGGGGANNNWISGKLGNINVVSPTWLSIANGDGDIKDVGSEEYAKTAQNTGYELWPLFSNSFNAEITHEALKSTSKRDKIIRDLTGILKKYGATGVNVDFESYKIEDGYYYTQFLRELCVSLRRDGFITSVDLPVPTLQNSPTDREQIGKYVDYVIVMAYDQHWAASQIKGPVAGYDWVYTGIERTLSLVPKEKTVLALPLYTRMWYQPAGSDTVTSRDFAMGHVSSLFETRNAEMVWEDNTKYMRGEYEFDIDGVKNTITAWLETAETLRYKAEIVNQLELAGAACWKKGLESEDVWPMLAETVK